MRWISTGVTAAILVAALASDAIAQRRATSGFDAGRARSANRPVRVQPAQQPAASGRPRFAINAGVATGDDPYDLGFTVGASARWNRAELPVTFRGDLSFSRHSGDIDFGFPGDYDLSLNLFGAMALVEYAFTTTGELKPYVFGGLGLFYANVDSEFDDDFGIGEDDYDSSTDLGFGIGGGLRFTSRLGAELRFMDVGGFTTIPLTIVIHL